LYTDRVLSRLRHGCIASAGVMALLIVPMQTSMAAPDDGGDAYQWQFFGALAYGPRDIDGDIFLTNGGAGSGYATADSLGLGTADSFQFRLGARYKRWRFSVDYLPTNYSGEGFALASIDLPNRPPIDFTTPVVSDIDVEILLANVNYELLQTANWRGSVGLGFGRTTLDISLDPEVGEGVFFDSNTPFGYISGDIRRYFGRWSVLAAIQWISGDFGGFNMAYGNFNVSAGYVFPLEKTAVEVLAGYRRIDFKFDYNIDGQETIADFTMEGPYIGTAISF